MSGERPRAANRLALDYRKEAENFQALPYPIIDIHTHINGARAAKLFMEAARLYGISRCYSMTPHARIAEVQQVMGDAVRFIAIPDYRGGNVRAAITGRYRRQIKELFDMGGRIVKFWSAPRRRELCPDEDLLCLDAAHNLDLMEYAAGLGMDFMVHVGDPDTWFATKYADSRRYGTKMSQYEPLEAVLERFRQSRWIAAHMGGYPEDFDFLSKLLDRHPNLYLDTSATKWMVRELSKYPREQFLAFFRRYEGRLLFGSDLVVMDEHLEGGAGVSESAAKASNSEEAFELYASRYWTLRTFFETDYRGESPIADPDLALLDPHAGELAAPVMRGMSLPREMLFPLYHGAAEGYLQKSAPFEDRPDKRISGQRTA